MTLFSFVGVSLAMLYYKICLRICGEGLDTDDVTQELGNVPGWAGRFRR